MPKLSDAQAVLLSTAAQREDGSLLPSPETLGAFTDRIRKAVGSLVNRTLAEEVDVANADRAWRCDGEQQFGAVITQAGRAAIGVEPVSVGPESVSGERVIASAAATPAEPRQTKASLVRSLLQREHGATLTELIEATSWLPHTTRAALTGLRKKGFNIAKDKRGDVTCYRITGAV